MSDHHERLAAAVHAGLLAGERHATLADAVRHHAPLLTAEDRAEVAARVAALVNGLGPVEPLLRDPEVNEVMVNGPGPVWVERLGAVTRTELAISAAELELLVERVLAPLGRTVDPRRPWVDGRLPDGSRVHVIAPPVAVDGPVVTIRRFVLRRQELEAFGSTAEVAPLRRAVQQGRSILVSGGTASGKTTLLNALAAELGAGLRVVTVEDAAELRLPHPHVVRLEGRPPGAEGGDGVALRDLVRNALRMRPDRIVVGEVRGAEAFDLVQALHTGHTGSLATLHANSPLDALDRLATMVVAAGTGMPMEAIERQVATAVDLVVQVARTGSTRRIVEVAQVVGAGRVETLREASP